ncbi:MAG: alpha/beta fold hydrolase [Deltaproteobacteria bacterium]|nr:MAG: alpha/beta fold hydrolase [Deltaproteobacteria bacterium]
MKWFWLIMLSPAIGAGIVAAVTYLLAWFVFPAGGSRGPHDTPARQILGNILVLLGEWLAASWVAYTMVFRWKDGPSLPRPRGSETPLIVLPGFMENPATLALLRRRLERALGVPVTVLKPPPYHLDIAVQARMIADNIRDILDETGAEKVNLLGHSLGGLQARFIAERTELGDRIGKVITVATPHMGSALASLLPMQSMRQMRRGSLFLEELNRDGPSRKGQLYGICSTHDNLVLPWNCSLSPHGDNFILRFQGHTTLLFSRQLVEIVSNILEEGRKPPHA